ncbi:GapA-binding peptide SR1P [Paenibacillus sp. GSMTC-2017]|nr:GapA-binding peptide SR1P [Paenibacillus sp. GSMTC-2017]MBH5318309.1 GapA-binding peptide SR1P [Paenibacillus sp. GSMTC-2017]
MRNSSKVNLGVILCKNCGTVIDTLDTEKVMHYYLNCGHEHCKDIANNQGEPEDDTE